MSKPEDLAFAVANVIDNPTFMFDGDHPGAADFITVHVDRRDS